MDRLVKKLEEVNSTNKQNLKKYTSKLSIIQRFTTVILSPNISNPPNTLSLSFHFPLDSTAKSKQRFNLANCFT